MWRYLTQSVAGTRHQRDGLPCQDYCLAVCESIGDEDILLLASADGAGSAPFADLGARLACEAVIRSALAELRDGQNVAQVDRYSAGGWLQAVRQEIERAASDLQTGPRDLASTLLLAVVGPEAAAFFQLGDGGIVVRRADEYSPIFWPQGGEYANDTNFVSDVDAVDRLAFEVRSGRIDELAMFSDGLQRLALNLSARSAHRPFFDPLFQRLRASVSAEPLVEPLRQFLQSPRVKERSDDDLTLVLATRVPPRAAADAV
jgi:hypothetical protein